jgi:hypothetical protein
MIVNISFTTNRNPFFVWSDLECWKASDQVHLLSFADEIKIIEAKVDLILKAKEQDKLTRHPVI